MPPQPDANSRIMDNCYLEGAALIEKPPETIESYVKQCFENRYSFSRPAKEDHGNPRYDHRYFSIRTLALNPGTQFSSTALAAHNPYPVNANVLDDDFRTILDSSNPLRDCICFDDNAPADANGSPNSKRAPLVFNVESTETETSASMQLKKTILDLEKISDTPETTIFPKPKLTYLLEYYDEILDSVIIFKNDLGKGVLRQWDKSSICVYASPIKFSYQGQAGDIDVGSAEIDAHVHKTFLRQKYSDVSKALYVRYTFSPDLVDLARYHEVTLLTYHDLARFLRVPNQLYEQLENDATNTTTFAPHFEEWKRLLAVHGLASSEVLDIIRDRQRQPSKEDRGSLLKRKSIAKSVIEHEIAILKRD